MSDYSRALHQAPDAFAFGEENSCRNIVWRGRLCRFSDWRGIVCWFSVWRGRFCRNQTRFQQTELRQTRFRQITDPALWRFREKSRLVLLRVMPIIATRIPVPGTVDKSLDEIRCEGSPRDERMQGNGQSYGADAGNQVYAVFGVCGSYRVRVVCAAGRIDPVAIVAKIRRCPRALRPVELHVQQALHI